MILKEFLRKNLKFTVFFLIGFTSWTNIYAAKKNPSSFYYSDLGKINKSIKKREKDINNLKENISRLEQNLNIGNRKYLLTIKKRKKIEELVEKLNRESKQSGQNVRKKIGKVNSIIKGIVLNSLGGDDSPSELLANKIMLEKLSNEKKDLEKINLQNDFLARQVKDLTERLKEYVAVENELIGVLRDLEFKKRDKTNHYVDLIKEKDSMILKKEQIKLGLIKERKVHQKKYKGQYFKSPINGFLGIEYKRKGVTYKFKGKKPIRAAAKGKVVYQGVLSNFGNVIMIDHGKQTKSVLLGSFTSNIKKGMAVESGQVLGHTRSTALKEGKLYFEVRKKNKVQNTFQLIDRNSLAKNQQS